MSWPSGTSNLRVTQSLYNKGFLAARAAGTGEYTQTALFQNVYADSAHLRPVQPWYLVWDNVDMSNAATASNIYNIATYGAATIFGPAASDPDSLTIRERTRDMIATAWNQGRAAMNVFAHAVKSDSAGGGYTTALMDNDELSWMLQAISDAGVMWVAPWDTVISLYRANHSSVVPDSTFGAALDDSIWTADGYPSVVRQKWWQIPSN